MPRKYESTEAVCPFYIGEDKRSIYCEGIAPGMTLALAFGKDAADYKFAFCRGSWEECRVASMLLEMHEKEN